jgi:choline trimethylamine-lyase
MSVLPPVEPKPSKRTDNARIDLLLQGYEQAEPRICLARARAVTQAYAEHQGAPAILKRAWALHRTCTTLPITIFPGELVVGASGSHRRSAGVSPEISWQWIREEIDTIDAREQDPYAIGPQERAELLDHILPAWQGRSIEEAFLARLPQETAAIAVDTGIVDNDSKWRCAVGEVTPDYQDILFAKGFQGIIDEAQDHLDRLDQTRAGALDKSHFYQAVIICGQAIIALARRYAAEAERLADVAEDPDRRRQLRTIAENCHLVPAQPPATFWQAVQMVWFVQLGNTLFENAVALNLGRFDQYMYPYYRRDLAAGRLGAEEGQALINALWLKLSEWIWFVSSNTASYFAGYSAF